MTLKVSHGIGTQIITATSQPKIGDREDFTLRVQGPDPHTDYSVPISMTGTILAMWSYPSPMQTAENLGAAIFRVIGTASEPPKEGFWFDSYNSGGTLQETINKIANEGGRPFAKNWTGSWMYVNSLGASTNKRMEELDQFFTKKFNIPFFKSLEDISEESQRVEDLNNLPKDHPGFIYRICIISGIIDHINLSTKKEDNHLCSVCGEKHKQSLGSLQNLKLWLVDKVGEKRASELTVTLSMIKKLRKQYPIHDHYVTTENIRNVRKEINEANNYFNIINGDFAHNTAIISEKFENALFDIKKEFE